MNFFGKKTSPKPNTEYQAEAIQKFLARGIENVFPSREAFADALKSGRKMKIYLGIDPTGPSLHMGHAIPLMKLGELQRLGHGIILLIGDFTAMIGDPTDKPSSRKQLGREEVVSNMKLYKKQASRFLKFSGANKASVKYNSSWLSRMKFAEVLDLASKMTVDQMMKRDMFRKRTEEGKPTFIHEFLYPLMQGYDSIAMDVDAEIGGNDQTFNMLAGRDLMKALKNKEKFVIATKLLVDVSGKKMGKTEGNMITLADSAQEMFGKVMSWTDGMIIPGFELCTAVSSPDIQKEKEILAGGDNPRDSKLKLAESVVAFYHGKEAGQRAKDSFLSTFSEKGMPADALEISAGMGTLILDHLLEKRVISSRTEWRRLIAEGAVRDMINGSSVTEPLQKIEKDIDLKIGKHRFVRIRVR